MFILLSQIAGFKFYRVKNNKLFVANKQYPHFKQLTIASIRTDIGIEVPDIIKIKNN